MNEQKYMWSYAGTALLISIWSQSSIQKQLKATLRNQGIWDGVARYMCKRGFIVNGRQCRTRIKNILVRYRDAKKSGNISGTGIEPYFHDVDRVMTQRNAQITSSAFSYMPPDPLASVEQMHDLEEHHQYDSPEGFEVNVKNELPSLSSNASEEGSQDPAPNQLFVRTCDEQMDDDQSSSSTYGVIEGMKSPIMHVAEKCEVIAAENQHSTSTDYQGATQTRHKQGYSLEQLVVHAIESQTEAVTKVLTAQHNLAKQLLEADRDRQMRLEYKLDSIIERLDHFIPPSSLPSSRTSNDSTTEEKHKLNHLLDRLDKVLPFIPSLSSVPKQRTLGKIQEDKIERILNRLEQLFPAATETSQKLNDI